MSQNSLPLGRLIEKAHQRLVQLGYSPNTCNSYRRTWRKLLRWSQEQGFQAITSDIMEQFLKEHGIPPGESAKPLTCHKRHIRAYIRVLEEFAFHGYWQLRRTVPVNTTVPPVFAPTVNGFLEHRKIHHNHFNTSTLSSKDRWFMFRFATFLESCHVKSWTDIHPEIIRAFFASQMDLKAPTLSGIAVTLRRFLKYLWLQGIHPEDLSPHVPQFKIKKRQRIPSVWRKEDVEKLLSTVDRCSPLGKRDYAILLLVIRLGLRVSEIRTLKLEQIYWEKSQLEIFQPKTGNTVLLPLNEEVGQALIDYLRNGRPPVTCREVFVRHIAPFKPFSQTCNLQHIVNTYRQRAHIPLDYLAHYGLHSLRHTLASRLLEQGTSIETIATILGHASVETTRIYTKVDLEALRSAALDPEEVFHEQA